MTRHQFQRFLSRRNACYTIYNIIYNCSKYVDGWFSGYIRRSGHDGGTFETQYDNEYLMCIVYTLIHTYIINRQRFNTTMYNNNIRGSGGRPRDLYTAAKERSATKTRQRSSFQDSGQQQLRGHQRHTVSSYYYRCNDGRRLFHNI